MAKSILYTQILPSQILDSVDNNKFDTNKNTLISKNLISYLSVWSRIWIFPFYDDRSNLNWKFKYHWMTQDERKIKNEQSFLVQIEID